MRVLRLGFWWLLVPVGALLLVLAFLFFTTAGARMVAAVAERALPSLQIEKLDGSIAFGLNAHRVTWSQPGVKVTLDGLAGWWDPHCFLQAKFCVHSLAGGRLHIEVPERSGNEPVDDDSGITPIDLPLLVLPWRLRIEQFYLAELHIQAGGRLTVINPVAFRAEWLGSRVAIEDWHAATDDPDIGALDVRLAGVIDMASEWPFNAALSASYVPPLDGWQAQHLSLSGEGNIRNLLLKGVANAQISIPDMEQLRLSADVSSQALDSEIQLQELHGQWNGAPLFAQGNAHVFKSGELTLKDMLIRWGKNQATLNGSLRDHWDLRAALAFTEPQLLAPEASGQLTGEAHVSGPRKNPLVKAQLQSEALMLPDLELRQFSLEASVAPVTLSSMEAHLKAATIRVGDENLQDADIKLQGDADAHTLELQVRRDQQNLQLMAEGALNKTSLDWKGKLTQLRAQLKKDWIVQLQEPVAVQWKHKARQVIWQHHCLQDSTASLCSEGWVDLTTLRGDVQLDISDFDLQKLRPLLPEDARMKGNLNANLRVQEHFLRPRLEGRLALNGLTWRSNGTDPPLFESGKVQAIFNGQQASVNVTLDLPPGLRWMSDGAVVVDWSQDGLALHHSCWHARRVTTDQGVGDSLGNLCLQVDSTEKSGVTARADLSLSVASVLHPFLPPALQVEGQLEGQAEARLQGSDLQATFEFGLERGEVRLLREQERAPISASVDVLRLSGQLQQEVLQMELELQSSSLGNGTANAEIEIRGQNPQMSLQARLQDLNLALVQPMLPQLSELQGAIDFDLQMQGAVAAPSVNGRLDVRDVQMLSSLAPIAVDDLDAQIIFTGNQGELKGQLRSGDGKADLTGDFTLADTGWQGRVNLKGRKIPVAQPPDIRFMVHPDLTLLVDNDSIDLEGSVLVNNGFIVLKPLPPDAIGVSSDVEFVDERGSKLQKETAMAIGLNVMASVEPSLRIRGFGGEVRPKGAVRIQMDRSGVLIGRGTIDITEGSYTGYGQQLKIRRGQAIFNGPLDQPYINLEAVRQVGNVVAGIRVIGPASEPVATLFSEPTLPDSQILYYIITGKPPGTGTESDDTAVRNALLSVGLRGGQPLARDIASKVGIDDLQMGTSGSGDETAVTLSGYINPRTYLQYGISVFQPVNTLTIRYRLRENLFLEAINGVASALDILYSFEF